MSRSGSRLPEGRSLVLFGLVWTLACARAPVPVEDPMVAPAEAPVASDLPASPDREPGLERVKLGGGGLLEMRPDRPIGAYDSFKLNRIDVTFSDNRFTARDEQRIRTHVRDTVMEDMRATGLPIVEKPDRCTLLVEVGIVDIKLIDPVSSSGAATHFVNSWGAATVVQRLFDGSTGAPLMRFATRRSIPGNTVSRTDDGRDWVQINETLDELIRDAQKALLVGLPIVDSAPMKAGCRGGIYELRKRTG